MCPSPWVNTADLDLSTGSASPEAALRPFLEQWQTQFGGTIVMVDEQGAALQLDGVSVVMVDAVTTADGGFAAADSTGCEGYEPDLLASQPDGGPATAPPVSPMT